jgi:curved DNA-binding protein CbpA
MVIFIYLHRLHIKNSYIPYKTIAMYHLFSNNISTPISLIKTAMKNKRNYYRLLQVQPDAPYEIIHASYRTIMKELKSHPDLGGEPSDAYLINEAYETLSDSAKRAEYDKKLKIKPIESYNKCINAMKTKSNEKSLNKNYHRSYNRIKKSGILHYSLSRLQTAREAKLLDVSPKGVRFLCSEELKQESIIRLKSPLFKAIVKVVDSQQKLLDDKIYYTAGAEFLKVSFKSPKGTFYSTSV